MESLKLAVVVLCLTVAAKAGLIVGPATNLVRIPGQDTAIIRFDRFGGSFAWSTIEGHAYSAVSPIVQLAPAPVPVPPIFHAPLVYSIYYPEYVDQVAALAAIDSKYLPLEHRATPVTLKLLANN